MGLSFEPVGSELRQAEVLYALLGRRAHGISHQAMPAFDEHRRFVLNHPYRAWWLVRDDDDYIGSVYVTDQNTVGINIQQASLGECVPAVIAHVKAALAPLPAIKSVRAGRFSVNVAPGNGELIAALQASGYSVAQVSFLL